MLMKKAKTDAYCNYFGFTLRYLSKGEVIPRCKRGIAC